MSWMRFATTNTPNGDYTIARCFAGESYEDHEFAGTIVMPSEQWEEFLDCLVLGSSQLSFAGKKLYVYFGEDKTKDDL